MNNGQYIWLESGHSSVKTNSVSNHHKMKALAAIVENASRLVSTARPVNLIGLGYRQMVDPDLLNSFEKSINSFIEG